MVSDILVHSASMWQSWILNSGNQRIPYPWQDGLTGWSSASHFPHFGFLLYKIGREVERIIQSGCCRPSSSFLLASIWQDWLFSSPLRGLDIYIVPSPGWNNVNLQGFHVGGSEVKASAWNAGYPGSISDLGSIPGLGRSPGEGNGNPLQYSCLENPMEGGAW